MEKHTLGDRLFGLVNTYLAENSLQVNRGTLVDGMIINALTLTKNKEKKGDPDMHQTRKGNQWYFGMKAHMGVDRKTKLIHSVAVTPANVHDSQVLEDLLHGDETRLWGGSVYAGQKKLLYEHAPNANFCVNKINVLLNVLVIMSVRALVLAKTKALLQCQALRILKFEYSSAKVKK
ncbi:MAG: hypothetical protein COC05_07100 [Gammaproteobacteria bacterium]|nr:MAG: hypothetical protein COC05_07100 [Gammaproteobacteria bacterium]